MCTHKTSELEGHVLGALGAAANDLTTEALVATVKNQGACSFHANQTIRGLRRTGKITSSGHSDAVDPLTFPQALWRALASAARPDRVPIAGGAYERFPAKRLGGGANGDVFEGRQVSVDRPVAIKMLHAATATSGSSSDTLGRRMEREGKALATLNHPNVVAVIDAGTDDTGRPFVVMERVYGRTLEDVIQQEKTVDGVAVARWWLDAARGLQHAHSKGILHRDIKPSNIMIREDGLLKVMDFGLAKLRDPEEHVLSGETSRLPVDRSNITRPGGFLGTFLYAAPEQYAGDSDLRSDIYGLGHTFYHALAGGQAPFNLERDVKLFAKWVFAHENVDEQAVDLRHASRRPDAPEDLARIVRRSIRRSPDERYQTYEELISDLERFLRKMQPATSQVGLTGLLNQIEGSAPDSNPAVEMTSPSTTATPSPASAGLGSLADRMKSVEARFQEQFGEKCLDTPGPLPTTLFHLAKAQGLVPTLRRILEAERQTKAPDFEELFLAAAKVDEEAPQTDEEQAPLASTTPFDITWYFYIADSIARTQETDVASSTMAADAEAIVSFLEGALGTPELAALRSGDSTLTPDSPVEPEPTTEGTIGLAADSSAPAHVPNAVAEDASAPPPSLEQGATLGPDHTVVRLLGSGGMGEVFLARHRTLEREDAVKVLKSALAADPQYVDRFHREAKLAAQLRHPNIVSVYNCFEWKGALALVMAYIPGTTLSSYMARQSRENRPATHVRDALLITRQIASALDYAHRMGLVHRDVKPPNILLDTEGQALLTDFGLMKSVRVEQADRTTEGSFWGTPEYASPEQANGQTVDPRTDIYSLGAVLYELLCGRVPYTAPTKLAILVKIANEKESPEPLRSFIPDLDPRVDALVSRMLAYRPEERYLRASEVVDEINRILGSLDGTQPRPATPSLAKRVFVGAAVLLVALAVGYLLWPGDGLPPKAGEGIAKIPTNPKPSDGKTLNPAKPAPPEVSFSLPSAEAVAPVPTPRPSRGSPEAHFRSLPPAPRPAIHPTTQPVAKKPEPAPVKPAPPKLSPLEALASYKPTDEELRTANAIFQILRGTLPHRLSYSFDEALTQLRKIENAETHTPWTRALLAAEIDRLNAAAQAFAERPLFDQTKESVLILRDGRSLRGHVHSETAAQVDLVLPNALREPIPLALILPTSLPEGSPDREGSFGPRAAAGDAAGVLPSLGDLPEEQLARHLPGVVSSAIDECLYAARVRHDFRVLAALHVSEEHRKVLGVLIEDRLKAFDAEKAGAELYLKESDREALATLLSQHRDTLAGDRAAGEILQSFLKSFPDSSSPEVLKRHELARAGVNWKETPATAPPESKAIFSEVSNAYVLKSPGKLESRIYRDRPGSRDGFVLRYRLGPLSDARDTLVQIGTSADRWLRIQGQTAFLVQQVSKPGGAELITRQKRSFPTAVKRGTVAVVPRPDLALNLWYLDGRLLWALPDGKAHYPINGIAISVFGGEVFVESVRVKNPN